MLRTCAGFVLMLALTCSALGEGQPGLSVATKPSSPSPAYTSRPAAPQLMLRKAQPPQTPDFYIRRSAPQTLEASPAPLTSQCPLDVLGWRQWRDQTANGLLSKYFEVGGQKILSHADVVKQADEANLFLKECRKSPSFSPDFEGVVANLERFAQTLGINNYNNHRFGFAITDQEYLDNIRQQAALPPLLKTQQFLKALGDPSTYKEAFRLIEEHNAALPQDQKWEVFLYKSRFLSTPDQARTNGRFFIYAPEGGFEKWIQFGIVTPGDPVRSINNVSIVSIGPPDANGNRPRAILDHWRTYEADGTISLSTRYEKVGQTENCAICHKTSPLGIHPDEEYVIAADGRLVLNTINPGEFQKRLNSRIEDYGLPFFRGWMNMVDFGPTIGPNGRQRDPTFMRACTSQQMLSEQSITNVQRSMRCSTCHNTDGLGPLNYPQSLRTDFTSGQVREYVIQGWMPPGNRLTSSEREALYNCLVQEYHDPTTQTGLLSEWLKGEAP